MEVFCALARLDNLSRGEGDGEYGLLDPGAGLAAGGRSVGGVLIMSRKLSSVAGSFEM